MYPPHPQSHAVACQPIRSHPPGSHGPVGQRTADAASVIRFSRSRSARPPAGLAGNGAGNRGPIRPRPIGPIRARPGCATAGIPCRSAVADADPDRAAQVDPVGAVIQFDQHRQAWVAPVCSRAAWATASVVSWSSSGGSDTPNSVIQVPRPRCRGGTPSRRRADGRCGRRSGRR